VSNRLSVHGISLTEYLVMHYLDAIPEKAVPRITLADHLGMSASGVTRLIAPMEKNGLIEREKNQRDARQSLVKLSATGQRLYGETRISFGHIARDLTRRLTETDLVRLTELHEKMLAP